MSHHWFKLINFINILHILCVPMSTMYNVTLRMKQLAHVNNIHNNNSKTGPNDWQAASSSANPNRPRA